MNDDRAKNDEERVDSFLNLLFGIDSGAMVFFLIVRGDKLGEGLLPFQLAFYPFRTQIFILVGCACGVLALRGLNLFLHDKSCFRLVSKLLAVGLMLATIYAIWMAAVMLNQSPDLLPSGNS